MFEYFTLWWALFRTLAILSSSPYLYMQVPKPLNHNATIFSQFSFLGLSPPATYADVPFALTQLQEKLVSGTELCV